MSYYIVEIDGFIHSAIDVENKPNKYGKVKYFKDLETAKAWIKKHGDNHCKYTILSRDGLFIRSFKLKNKKVEVEEVGSQRI